MNYDPVPTTIQSSIASATANNSNIYDFPVKHHPITCTGELFFDEEGAFSCEHQYMPPNDPRTHACLVHSVACLIVELACKL